MNLGTVDLVVLGAYMAAMVAFGLWMGRGQRGAADYLLGGRDLPWWALLLSIVATETSTVTFLSVPGIAYGGGLEGTTGDLRFLQLPLGYIIGRVLVVVFLLPQYFRGSFFTAYEVLQKRFGGATRKVTSLLFLVTRTLADGLRLFLTAIVLELLTPFSITESVLAIGAATVLYTFFGGMRAVVWTDVVQFLVYMGGAVLAFSILLGDLQNGWADVAQVAADGDKFRVFDFRLVFDDPYVFWAGLIGGAFLSFGSHGVDQLIVQRYLCARSQQQAGRALWLSGVVVLAQFAFFLVLGVALYAFYRQHPPTEEFAKSDRVFADFVVHNLPAGLLGIVLGAVFSAAMSTLSSSLNSSASAATNDFLLPMTGRESGDPLALRWARIATLVFAGLQVLVGISGLGGGAVVGQVLAIASFTTGILLGVFFLGAVEPVRQRHALIGVVCGLVVVSFLQFGLPLLAEGVTLAWPWFALVGAAATFAGGMAATTLDPDRSTPKP